MKRFVTYIDDRDTDTVLCMSESDFKQNSAASAIISDSAEYVWQFANSKEQAISQHFAKHDAWRQNPEMATY